MERELLAALDRGEPLARIAASFHLTEDSIRWRLRQLGRSLRDGWHSRQTAAAMLGVSWRVLERWQQSGDLAVERHGRRWLRITDASLRACVERRAGLDLDPAAIRERGLRRLAETSAVANRRRALRGATS